MKHPIKDHTILMVLAFFAACPAFGMARNITHSNPQTYYNNIAISPLSRVNSGIAAAIPGIIALMSNCAPRPSIGGVGPNVQIQPPLGITLDLFGQFFVANAASKVVRLIASEGQLTTVAGISATASIKGIEMATRFNHPGDISSDEAGDIPVSDLPNHRVRQINSTGNVSILAGNRSVGFVESLGTISSQKSADAEPLLPGSITTTVQTINYGADAATLTSTSPASGGSGNITYLWQISRDNSTWTDISGAISPDYQPHGVFENLYFRREAKSNGGAPVYSNSVQVKVYPQLLPGSITTTEQTISYGTDAATLTSTTPGTGGNGTITYQWQISTDNSTWTDIGGATAIEYQPKNLGITTYYRRTAISNAVGVFSNSVKVTVLPPGGSNPTANMNYTITSTLRKAVNSISGQAQLAAMDVNDVNQTIQYFDGLGRPLQTVSVKASPQKADVIQPFVYDQFGREVQKYLPYAETSSNSDGRYRPEALSQGLGVTQFYDAPPQGVVFTEYPYSQTVIERSPLNRVVEQGAPGATWQPATGNTSGHTVKIEYLTNNEIDITDTANTRSVRLYLATVNPNGSRTLNQGDGQNSYYQAGQLYVTVIKDENWKSGRGGTTEEYKDIQGRVVLKRSFNYNPEKSNPAVAARMDILSTYYVYDELGNLAFTLPPGTNADAAGVPQYTGSLGYIYRYDERNRLTQKKVPGKGWDFTVYNRLDQPVLTQDSLQRVNNQWTVIKYDGLGRVVVTGLWNAGSAIPLSTLQGNIYSGDQWDNRDFEGDAQAIPTSYILKSYPTLSKILNVNYYDRYDHVTQFPAPNNDVVARKMNTSINIDSILTKVSTKTQGLLVASQTAVLNTLNNTAPAYLLNVHYYDDLGRNIYDYQLCYFNGQVNNDALVTLTEYNFNNQAISTSRTRVTVGVGQALRINNNYIYDHAGRKIKTWQQIINGSNTPNDNDWVLLNRTDYNEIGQLMTKHLHATFADSTHFRQDVSYTYNERGWLNSIRSDLFNEVLYYNDGIIPQYNGNISNQLWNVSGAPAKVYSYHYDQLNRLKFGLSTDGDNEKGISYDAMGNITKLNRYTKQLIADSLTYNYFPGTNKLQSVVDISGNDKFGLKNGTTNYQYDGNGNLTADDRKAGTGITLTYNLMNLPETITGLNTSYIYDAGGKKLTRIANGIETDYIDGIQYEGPVGNPTLSFIQTEDGRALPNGSTYNYEYTIKDHLGNSRVSFDSFGPIATAKQVDDYYPFGMDNNRLANGDMNKYLYNDHELQDNLGTYDYGARFYDPVIARWNSIDGMAENHYDNSPYQYVLNNPMLYRDYLGLDTTHFDSKDINIGNFNQVKEGEGQIDLPEVKISATPLGGGFSGFPLGDYWYGNSGFGSFSMASYVPPPTLSSSSGPFTDRGANQGGDPPTYRLRHIIKDGIEQDNTPFLILFPVLKGIKTIWNLLSLVKEDPQAELQSIRELKNFKYDPRLENQTNLYHDFPRSFDRTIIENAPWAQRIKDGANWFESPGWVNDKPGNFQIGINDQGVIFHRNFVPLP